MHEMSLAESVLQLVEETASREQAQRVKLVILEIGRLSSVEPDAMRFCFEAVTSGSPATLWMRSMNQEPASPPKKLKRRALGCAGADGVSEFQRVSSPAWPGIPAR